MTQKEHRIYNAETKEFWGVWRGQSSCEAIRNMYLSVGMHWDGPSECTLWYVHVVKETK